MDKRFVINLIATITVYVLGKYLFGFDSESSIIIALVFYSPLFLLDMMDDRMSGKWKRS